MQQIVKPVATNSEETSVYFKFLFSPIEHEHETQGPRLGTLLYFRTGFKGSDIQHKSFFDQSRKRPLQ